MKRIILAAILLVTLSGSIDARTARSYIRKDGAFVSGYTTGSSQANDNALYVAVVAFSIAFILVVCC